MPVCSAEKYEIEEQKPHVTVKQLLLFIVGQGPRPRLPVTGPRPRRDIEGVYEFNPSPTHHDAVVLIECTM